MYSRIDKLVREGLALDSLAEASDARNIPINLVLGSDRTGKVAIMATTALALALRCFKGEIGICCPRTLPVNLPWCKGTLIDYLAEEASRYGGTSRIKFLSDIPEHNNTLALGAYPPNGVVADAAGWVASINHILPEVPSVAPAAVFATCCAFAKLFKATVLGDIRWLNEQWTFSLWDFITESTVPAYFETPIPDLGHIALLGVGAIGAGFAHVIWLSGCSAELDIIDRDFYDEPNLETTVMIGKSDALQRRPKAKILSGLFASRPGLTAEPIVIDLKNGQEEELLRQRNVFVCAVDNPETRRLLDNINVDILLNGAVGGTSLDSGHVLWSRHSSSDPVLSTLYREKALMADEVIPPPKEVTDECSRLAYQGTDMAAPFIGLSSSALLAASCMHHALGKVLDTNYFKFDLLRKQECYQREEKRRVSVACIPSRHLGG